jgi:hypothetical protein
MGLDVRLCDGLHWRLRSGRRYFLNHALLSGLNSRKAAPIRSASIRKGIASANTATLKRRVVSIRLARDHASNSRIAILAQAWALPYQNCQDDP